MTNTKTKIDLSLMGILNTILNFLSRVFHSKKFKFVINLYIVAFLMFCVTLVQNKFTIPVQGDFVLQEIPFYYNGYDDWWKSIKTGNFVMWDDSAFLGVNNIGANAFYYLFNPFFLPILLVPRSLIPQAQAFMMMTKLVLAGCAMNLLLKQFNIKEDTRNLCSIAYAFNGWALFYLWFNHFLEIAVLMPLFLYGIEKVIREQRPYRLIVIIFITGLTNYFFLIAFCFTGVLYALVRYFQSFKKYTKEEKGITIVQGILGFGIGLMLSSIIMIPCFKVALENTRVSTATYLPQLVQALKGLNKKGGFKNLFEVLFVWKYNLPKNMLYPLMTFFFPTASCYDGLLTVNSGYDNALSSLYVYTPFMLFLIPSLLHSIKQKKVSHIVSFLGIVVLLITPFAYYCFSGFTSVAYGRWQIFVIVVSLIYFASNFDHRREMPKWYLDISIAVVLAIQIFLIVQTKSLVGKYNVKEMDDRIIYAYVEMGFVVAYYLYMRKNFHEYHLASKLWYCVAVEAIVMGNVVLIYQGTCSYQNLYHGESNVSEETRLINKINKEDNTYFRMGNSSADRDGDNLAMIEGYRGVSTFHSVYDYYLNDFINWSHISYDGSWSMGVHEKRNNLNEFLGMKYYILKSNDTNVPYGYSLYDQTATHKVYKNDNFIELGYAFDKIYPTKLFNSSSNCTLRNEAAYLSGAILSQEDIDEINSSNNFEVKTSLPNIYTVYNPSYSNVTVHRALWDHSTGTFLGYEDPAQWNGPQYGLLWNSKIEVNTKVGGVAKVCTNASSNGGCFVSIHARMGENMTITLYGEDDEGNEKVLTSDNHMNHWYDKTYDWKYERGFYVYEPVTRYEITLYDTMNNSHYIDLPIATYEYNNTYQAQVDALKLYQFTNVKHGTNSFSFDTNYEDKKMVVLTIPYDNGWSLVAKKDGEKIKPKIYISTGGFISFVSETGETHYELTYETPGLSTGVRLMSLGMVLFGVIYVVQIGVADDKKRCYELLRLN